MKVNRDQDMKMDLKDKRVLVAGTGISGISAARLLEWIGAVPVIFDGNSKIKREDVFEKLEKNTKAELVLGDLDEEKLQDVVFAVLSPGIPLEIPPILKLKELGIPVWSEVELAYTYAKGKLCAITGTNGKTTTTALVGAILKAYYEEVYVVGNIGIPYTGIVSSMTEKAVTAAEISSFQMETAEYFQPDVSAILNISPDHLDRHKTMENYVNAKLNIAKNQTENQVCILNYDDEITRKFGEKIKASVLYFSRMHKLEKGVYMEGTTICLKYAEKIEKVCTIDEMHLLGDHNVENVMAAIAVSASMGVPAEFIRNVVLEFQAVEHRIEFVAEKNGIAFYNDSKGTNPDAAIKGIKAMKRPTFLIAGGYDKQSDYTEWIQSFEGKVKWLLLIGQTREKIAYTAKECGFEQIILRDTLEEAVDWCYKAAKPGDAILLSPACASWGMFRNYEERGNIFKDYIHKLQ